MNLFELLEIQKQVKVELTKYNEYKALLKKEQMQLRNERNEVIKKLIQFINAELGFDIALKTRKTKYVMLRHAFYLNVLNDIDLQTKIVDLSAIFNCNHATIIANKKTALSLKQIGHSDYITAEITINQLINQFKTKQNAKQELAESIEQLSETN